jgi:hypothetical protein
MATPELSAELVSAGVAERVARLRELASADPSAAREDVWAWFAEAGRRVCGPRRSEAIEELSALFAAGDPPERLEGRAEGALVAFAIAPPVDRALAAVASLWLPWAGKSFDPDAARGENLLPRAARPLARLLWPTYRMADRGELAGAFAFRTSIGPGAVGVAQPVLVIDYGAVPENPRPLIRSMRDELVEVVPGAHLGRILLRRRAGRHVHLGYFALKSAPGG